MDSQTEFVENEADRELLRYLLAIHAEHLRGEYSDERADELARTERLRRRFDAPDQHPDPRLVETAEDVLELVRGTMYPQAAVKAQNLAKQIERVHNE